ncbi:AAA ATPase-like protein [Mycobacterium sp. BK558]|nr:AAA ATPase-like protein [Mycobacterium sp. BK558]
MPRAGARYCDACGSPTATADDSAEHKLVTVLFADVVRSMDLAAVLGSEQLREVMSELFNICGAVIQRYGGTVNQFTGDGIMALFGAPIALEDHAVRACVAALQIQREASGLAADLHRRGAPPFRLRVGLNSGDVVVGHLGSAAPYTAIGVHVGMAQRMESVAPPGGVMLSDTTARLVEDVAVLDDAEMVRIKGGADPVPAHRLRAMAPLRTPIGRRDSTLVGREREMTHMAQLLDEAIRGHGRIVGITGPAGIGKSRICRDMMHVAQRSGIEMFSTFCESHANEVPFHAVARLLRDVLQIEHHDPANARSALRAQLASADPEDLVLLDDLLGIRDSHVASPVVPADARRRRLATLLDGALRARRPTAVYVVEDAHWIDEASESVLADLLITPALRRSLVIITCRPEYGGALVRFPGQQRISLSALDDSAAQKLTAELIGSDPSIGDVAAHIVERSAGNPFYIQEIVREFAERGVIVGGRGAYRQRRELTDVRVPATLQATIGARIDRLSGPAKRTVNAAAVIGSRFDTELIAVVSNEVEASWGPALAELVHAELIDQVMFSPRVEYEFRHPLVRTVAYQSQLRSARAERHRRLAEAIERRTTSSPDENAALIATHLEAAGDLRDAFGWHMRAGTWFTNRDINAARSSWQRACQLADRLPADDPDQDSMRIAPRAMLCGSAWRAEAGVADRDFADLRELCTNTDDQKPLVMGMAGLLSGLAVQGRIRDALALSAEYLDLLESLSAPDLSVGLLYPVIHAEYEAGQMAQVLERAQRVIDLAEGDATKGNFLTGSPLSFATAMLASAHCALGDPNWRTEFDEAMALSRVDPTTYVSVVMFKYVLGILSGALQPDATALDDTEKALHTAHRCSEDFAVHAAQLARGVVLVTTEAADRDSGFELLASVRAAALEKGFIHTAAPIVDVLVAAERARTGDLDGAVTAARGGVAELLASGAELHLGAATTVFVESLLARARSTDMDEARAAIDRLTTICADSGLAIHRIPLLRMNAALALAGRDEPRHRVLIEQYQAAARSAGFDGHLAPPHFLAT